MNQAAAVDSEIRIHLVDGSSVSYAAADAGVLEQRIGEIQPAKLFGQRFMIAEHGALTGYSGNQIEKIDFVRPSFGGWAFPEGILHMTEITESDFNNQSAQVLAARGAGSPGIGDMFLSSLECHMTSGRRIFATVEGAVAVPAERIVRLQQILSAPALHFRLAGGQGNSVLNLGHLISFRLVPAPSQVATDTWFARRL